MNCSFFSIVYKRVNFKIDAAFKRSIRVSSDEGLTLETPAFRISVRWPIYIINSVDKTKFKLGDVSKTSRTSVLWGLKPRGAAERF